MQLLTKETLVLTAAWVTLLTGALSLDGCQGGSTPAPRPSVSGDVQIYLQGPPCREERYEGPAGCLESSPLPQCSSEDDAADGASGPECYWVNPDTGGVWYNDGNGFILP